MGAVLWQGFKLFESVRSRTMVVGFRGWCERVTRLPDRRFKLFAAVIDSSHAVLDGPVRAAGIELLIDAFKHTVQGMIQTMPPEDVIKQFTVSVCHFPLESSGERECATVIVTALCHTAIAKYPTLGFSWLAAAIPP